MRQQEAETGSQDEYGESGQPIPELDRLSADLVVR